MIQSRETYAWAASFISVIGFFHSCQLGPFSPPSCPSESPLSVGVPEWLITGVALGELAPGWCTEDHPWTASQDPPGKSYSYLTQEGGLFLPERDDSSGLREVQVFFYLQNSLGATKTRQCCFFYFHFQLWCIYKGLLLATAKPTVPAPRVRDWLKVGSICSGRAVSAEDDSLPPLNFTLHLFSSPGPCSWHLGPWGCRQEVRARQVCCNPAWTTCLLVGKWQTQQLRSGEKGEGCVLNSAK